MEFKVDAAALPAQVTVRTRRGGERLRPRVGGPERTLKSLMQQEAVALQERQHLPLLFAGEHLVAAGDLWVKLSELAMPVTLVRAMGPGSVVDDDDEAEFLRRLPSATIVHVADSGHSVQGDQPLVLAALLEHVLGVV